MKHSPNKNSSGGKVGKVWDANEGRTEAETERQTKHSSLPYP
jgi:hypothetical protein